MRAYSCDGDGLDKYTFSSLIKCCANELGTFVGVGIHGLCFKYGVVDDLFVGSSLIDFYGKCKLIGNAQKVFDEMPMNDVVSWTCMVVGYVTFGDLVNARKVFDAMPKKNQVSWNAMISGYVKFGQLDAARKLFDELSPKNAVTYTTMIDGYGKCDNMERAMSLFNDMPKRDLVSYCAMIQGLSMHGQGMDAVKLFYNMLYEGLIPNEVAFTVILRACNHSALVEEGYYLFNMMSKYSIIPSPDQYACLIDLLGRSGKLNVAYDLLNSLLVEAHAEAWGAHLRACRLHCDSELAEVVANQIVELEPHNAGKSVLLSNDYAAADRWLDDGGSWT